MRENMLGPLVKVQNLSKSYGDKVVLQDISFEVMPHQTLAIIGPSGSGKSTILRILAGLLEPDTGEIDIKCKNWGMAFQYSALLNSYTVAENVALGLHYNDLLSPSEKIRVVEEKLEMLGMAQYKNSMPYELSGGQQKRVSFARAIVNDPRVVFYDEPTAGLDPISSTILEDYINTLCDEYQAAEIVVTHQHSTIKRTADYIICLNKGGIVWQGTPKEMMSDTNPYIRQFIDGNISGPFTHSDN